MDRLEAQQPRDVIVQVEHDSAPVAPAPPVQPAAAKAPKARAAKGTAPKAKSAGGKTRTKKVKAAELPSNKPVADVPAVAELPSEDQAVEAALSAPQGAAIQVEVVAQAPAGNKFRKPA